MMGVDERKDELLRYFQHIDRGLHALLREETAPLVLAGVEYLAATQTLLHRGAVYAVEQAQMPAETPLAAVFRY